MNKYLTSASIALLLCSSAAYAGSPKSPYVGAALGFNTSIDDNDLSTDCGVGGVACREICDTDRAMNVYAGYPITSNLAIEAGYTDLDYTARLIQDDDTTFASQQTKGISVSAVARHALDRNFGIYGKAGAFAWESDVDSSAGAADDSGVSPTVGVGVEYNFSDHWGLRAGWDRYFGLGEGSKLLDGGVPSTVDEDIDTASIGLHYNF